MNNAISVFQNVWVGGCGRTSRAWHITEISFFTSRNFTSLSPVTNNAPIYCIIFIYSTQTFVSVHRSFFLRSQKFNYGSLFVTCIIDRRHLTANYPSTLCWNDLKFHTQTQETSNLKHKKLHFFITIIGWKKMWDITFWVTLVYRHFIQLLRSRLIASITVIGSAQSIRSHD